MTAAKLLDRLEGVKATGSERWIARCPGHDDRGPSLSIRQLADGRTLLHCFAGCSAEDVLAAVGLAMSDLFPEPLGHHFPPSKASIPARDALATLRRESLVVAVIGADFVRAQSLDEPTWQKLAGAVSRINQTCIAAGIRERKP